MDLSRNNNLTAYKGAWIYPVSDGWEGNLRGFHYSADTIDELKSKLDAAIENDDPRSTLRLYSAEPKHYTAMDEDEESTEDGIEWSVQFQLNLVDDYDDNMDQDSIEEVIISAPDFDTASKYAQQYARQQAHEDSRWNEAEVISITRR